ncbi:MAG: hypothetical protein Q7J34_08535 [Bacteroidales bacterium]|jgi:hypothetical protein|nr:hypothetical protein [Bacteroidales bacterium]
MDSSTTIVGIILLLISILPVALIKIAGNKKQKKLKLAFIENALTQDVHINQCDIWEEKAIGMDPNKALLIYQNTNGTRKDLLVDIKQIKACKSMENIRQPMSQNPSDRFVEQIFLEVQLSNSKSINLEFFNSQSGLLPNGEKKLCEKWAGILNTEIVKVPAAMR